MLTTATGGGRGEAGWGGEAGAGAEPGAKSGERCGTRSGAPSVGWKLWRPARGRSARSAPGAPWPHRGQAHERGLGFVGSRVAE